jgi:hypothetical protein
MQIEATVRSLEGAPLVRLKDTWAGFFEGIVGVENVQVADGSVRFEILIPTSPTDFSDFIWQREQAHGTTNKIVLTQRGLPVPGSKVIAIDREGADARWTAASAERYRITFELPVASLQQDVPLDLVIRWPDPPEAEDVATATGRLRL